MPWLGESAAEYMRLNLDLNLEDIVSHSFFSILFTDTASCKAVGFLHRPRYQKSIHRRWCCGDDKTEFSMEPNLRTRCVNMCHEKN